MKDNRNDIDLKRCIKDSNGISNYLLKDLIPIEWKDGHYPISVKLNKKIPYETENFSATIKPGIYYCSINTRASLFIPIPNSNAFIRINPIDDDYEIHEYAKFPNNINLV